MNRTERLPDTDIASVTAALRRAAEAARQVAIQHGTPMVLWRDGKVAHVDPHSLPCFTAEETQTSPTP